MKAMAQLFFAPAFTICLGELLGEGGDDLFAIFGTLILEDFGLDAFANLPIEEREFGINGNSGTVFCGIDELPDFLEERIVLG
jgi:hypothetical protein